MDEVAVFAEDPETGLQLKGRIDRLTEDDAGTPIVVDIKTTDDALSFERVAARFRYDVQDAFYTNLLRLHGIEALFMFIVVQVSEPYTVRVGYLDAPSRERGARDMRRALNLYHKLNGARPAYRLDDDGRRVGIETFRVRVWDER